MYRNIMVPLDGSLASEAAITTGADLARRARARLHLVQVTGWLEGVSSDVRNSTRKHLDIVAERVSTTLGVETTAATLWDPVTGVDHAEPPLDTVIKQLSRYVTDHHIDVVVMSTHGRGGFKRAWLGSVADEMLRHSQTTILTIKPGASALQAHPPILAQRILIPVDMTTRDEETIARAMEFGEMYGAEYTLLHVIQPMAALIPAGAEGLLQESVEHETAAHESVDRLALTMADTGHRVHTEVTSMPFIASEILGYASAHHFDLIAVGSHGSGPVRRAVLGSVADKIIRGASVPVLACHIP